MAKNEPIEHQKLQQIGEFIENEGSAEGLPVGRHEQQHQEGAAEQAHGAAEHGVADTLAAKGTDHQQHHGSEGQDDLRQDRHEIWQLGHI